jgi:divalent metal cation (Fe/Co/Zn/Cd) transporter
MSRPSLTRFAWLSIAAALVTILLKTWAWYVTGSVGLLSDALESVVNLIGGVMALAMLTIAQRPADEDHAFGHGKAEYFSSGVEGSLILVAAASIGFASFERLMHPQPLEQPGLGLAVALVASLVNLAVALVLRRVGRERHSITLEANAQHLLTDVWTSVGVLAGVGLVVLTGWNRLDPIVGLLVAANIVWTGAAIVRRSIAGTRQSGSRKFISFHVLVPGKWTVRRGHELLEKIERDIAAVLPETSVFTHLEALEDPASWEDDRLDRSEAPPPSRPPAEIHKRRNA